MKRFLLAMIIALIAGFVVPVKGSDDYKPDLTLSAICTNPLQISFILPTKHSQSLPLSKIPQIRAIDGTRIYKAYGDGWDVPPNARIDSWAELFSWSRGTAKPYYLFIYASPDEPTLRYLFLFNSLKRWCSPCGEHDFVKDGKLPTAFAMPKQAILDLYAAVGYDWLDVTKSSH